MAALDNNDAIDRALTLLGLALEAESAAPVELVVIGGAALSILEIVIRPTRDVDVLAMRHGGPGGAMLVKIKSLPESVRSAAATVAKALDLDRDWLNTGPADLMDAGLPKGFEERLISRRYGAGLTVLLPARMDLIRFKFYAAADLGPGRHVDDLRALDPSCEELLDGARWVRTQDPSEAFLAMVVALLEYMGCHEAAEAIAHGR
jgi:hypothetical protein